MHNFTYIMENFWSWSTQGYVTTVGYFFYPIIISAIIGYIYLKSQSAVVASVAILLFVSAFGMTGIFADVSSFVILLEIIAILSCSALVVLFVSRWRS